MSGAVGADLDPLLESAQEAARFRSRFPIFTDKIHLATNAKGALSDVAIAAQQAYQESWSLGAPWDIWGAKHEDLRAACARVIGAAPGEVALCYSLTQALSTVASALSWESRPAVVFDDYSFPSVAQLWHAQTRHGAEVRQVGPDESGEIRPEAFDHVMGDDVQVVSVAHLCYKNGHRLDFEAVRRRAHDAGAMFILDDYQSFGSRALDVHDSALDVYAAGMLKYMLGSPGVVMLYVREGLHDRLHPTITGWFGQSTPAALHIDRHEEAGDATRFQIGTPAIPAIYDSLAGVELIESVGLAKIERWIAALTARLMDRLQEQGLGSSTPRDPARRGPQVAIRVADPPRVVDELAARGIIVSWREDCIRTAWHFYNDAGDIDALIDALIDLGPIVRGAPSSPDSATDRIN